MNKSYGENCFMGNSSSCGGALLLEDRCIRSYSEAKKSLGVSPPPNFSPRGRLKFDLIFTGILEGGDTPQILLEGCD